MEPQKLEWEKHLLTASERKILTQKSSTKYKKEKKYAYDKGYNITARLRITSPEISYTFRMHTIVYFEIIQP